MNKVPNAMVKYCFKHGSIIKVGNTVYCGANPVYISGIKVEKGIPFIRVTKQADRRG